jgi:hypothetical protein
METQLNELTQMMKALQAQNSMIQRTLNDNLATLHDVGVWRPKIDAKVDEMHQWITVLQQKVDSLASHPPASNAAMCDFDTEAINLTKSAAPHSTVTSPAISLPIGAGDETSNRGIGHGVVTTLVPTPVKGANTIAHPSVVQFESQMPFDFSKVIPQLDFPKFDGKNPKL